MTEPPARTHALGARFYSVATRIEVPHASDVEHLEYYFKDYLVDDLVNADLTVRLKADNGSGFIASLGGQSRKTVSYRHAGSTRWEMYEQFRGRTTRPTLLPPFAVRPLNGALAVRHGSAVRAPSGDEALVFCGPSGAGKSVLLLAMIHLGWAFVTDDVLVIDRTDGRLRYYGRPVGVRQQTLPLLPWLTRDARSGRPVLTGTGTTFMVRPERLGAVVGMEDRIRPSWLVRLRRSAGFAIERTGDVVDLAWQPARHLDDAVVALSAMTGVE